jgi:hypothetical protein
MELDITQFFNNAAPMDYSASRMEIGDNAGQDTWRAANDDSDDYPLLQTDEQREAFRSFVKDSGGWTEEEIAAWSDTELNALCIQWVSGDMREGELKPGMSEDEWKEYERLAERGTISSRISRGDNGRIYFYVGS